MRAFPVALPAALAALFAVALPAGAEEDGFPAWSHEAVAELTLDHAGTSEDVLALTVEYVAALKLSPRLLVEVGLVLEPVGETGPNSAFEDEGLYAGDLKVGYAGDAFTLAGGKFAPAFGLAVDTAPGLYGTEIAEAYELAEMTGAGGDVNLAALLPGLAGDHVLSAAAFSRDRSVLSRSLLHDRGRVRLEDGGPGNAEGLSSWAAGLNGELPSGWGYSLGVRSLAAGETEPRDERAAVAGLRRDLSLTDGIVLELMGEVVAVEDADGIEGARRHFHTLSALLTHADWHGAAIWSGQADSAAAGGLDLGHVELSLGRDLGRGAALDAGIRLTRENGQESVLAGLRLSWEFGA